MTEPTSGYPTPKNYDSAIEHGSFTFLNNNPEGGYTLLTPTIAECPRCLFTSDVVSIPREGQCEYCNLHDQLEASAVSFAPILNKIKRKGKNKKYDCVIGISGGVDSSTLLYAAVKLWGLRPLVVHMNTWLNHKDASYNMKSLIKQLGVDCQIHFINKTEYDAICVAVLRSGVPDMDIPNDLAMTRIVMDVALKNNIKFVLNGHDFRTEGSSPKAWSRIDQKYLNDIYAKHKLPNDPPMRSFPQYTFARQLLYAFKNISQVRPFHYADVDRKEIEKQMRYVIGFKDYGGIKHGEHHLTRWISYDLLPGKYQINKTITYLSAQIRSGDITKDEAKKKLCEPCKMEWKVPGYLKLAVGKNVTDRNEYAQYDFKKYKPFMWVLMKLKLIPFLFFKKYCA